MKTDDMTFVAEALLAICNNDRRLTDFVDKRTQPVPEFDQSRRLYQSFLRGREHDVLLEIECREICALARLTRHQTEVLDLRLGGMTFEQIGRCRRHSKQAAQNIFLQAIKKFARALHVYPYAGLADVYRHETRRGL